MPAKGSKLSEEQKEHLRLINTGKKHSEKTKKKMSSAHKGVNIWSKGRKWTDEQKKSLKGRKVWNTGKKCPSLAAKISGDKCHFWKGGITPGRLKIRNSAEFKEWRRKVFKRDNYTCQECTDKRGGNLEAHHIKPFSKYPKLRFEVTNGQTLCKECHKKTDSYGGLSNKKI